VAELYDKIGQTYTARRQADPRIMAAITAALGHCDSVLNVGAGTGSYEPVDRYVIAAEPARTMLQQRPRSAAAAVQARSEALPFSTGSFAATLAVLTLHHWSDLTRGLAECARVARERCVFLTFDLDEMRTFWLLDYFPNILSVDRGKSASLNHFADIFRSVDFAPVWIPADCRDGFLGAYWLRPEAYLDVSVRAGISTFTKLEPGELKLGLERLQQDLRSGTWQARYAQLTERQTLDLGYRLVICRQ
jgi:SAM-dependent methyltransferase